MFLRLSEKWGMNFYFGSYDSGKFWHNGDFEKEVDINREIFDEVWSRYGKSPAFKGWYLSQEVSRKHGSVLSTYSKLGKHAKSISGGLPVMISPFIQGVKAVSSFEQQQENSNCISPEKHEKEWNEIFDGIKGAVDTVAFQDGHVDFHELVEYLEINKSLAEKHDLQCWTNCESFDRDMPIKFLPIKWEKMLLKLNAAQKVGIDKIITFEFSHFMSPNSCYKQAQGLYNRYREWLEATTTIQ
jgi:hypothetical protein